MSLRERLSRSSQAFTAVALVASFGTYFSMYMYRKAFVAASYEGPEVLGLGAKSVYVIAQAIGYAVSKFLGIKVVSELSARRRATAILASIGAAELALVLFGALPRGVFASAALAVNGLSLGMVWGMVFGFLEGRKTSDLLGAGLCVSFIVASGAAKAAGKGLLAAGVPEPWMPAVTGLCAAPAMVLFVAVLAQLPSPTAEDEAARTERVPMNGAARRAFFMQYAPGLVLLVAAYVLLTSLRDFRDNFAVEIWAKLGFEEQPSLMATTEIPVGIGAILGVAGIGAIASNRRALLATHGLVLFGGALAGLSTLAFQAQIIGPITWMITLGLGLYIAYVPYNCVLFDRLVAAAGSRANAGFLIYVADASGYAGSVATLVYKNLGKKDLSWLSFLEVFALVTSVFVVVAVALSAAYFSRRLASRAPP